jgi:molybdopterin biosynthesis enzyme
MASVVALEIRLNVFLTLCFVSLLRRLLPAGWPGLPNNETHETWFARLVFGVQFLARLPLTVAIDMTANIISYIVTTNLSLAQSVTPLLGTPTSYEYQPNPDIVGDVAAKTEARNMILASKLVEDLPVDFESSTSASSTAEANGFVATSVESPSKTAQESVDVLTV